MTTRIGSWWSRPCSSSRILAIAALSPILTSPLLADYAAEVLSENPLVYYRFDDAVSTADMPSPAVNLGSLGAAGAGNYLIGSGGTTGSFIRGVAGALPDNSAVAFAQPNATAIDFVGSISIPNHASLNPSHLGTNPFTVECWVKPNTNTSTLLSPVNSMSFTTGRAGFLIYQNGATWQLRMGNKASTTASILDGGVVTPGQWQHLAATYTGGSSGTMTLYVNGVQVGSAAVASYETNDNAPFVIGATSAPNRTFDGAVDEVAFFSSQLAPARIQDRFTTRTNSPAGYEAHVLADAPVGYWRLNEAPFVPRASPPADNLGTLGNSADGSYLAGAKNTATGPGPSSGFTGFTAGNSSLSLPDANGYVTANASLLNGRSSFTVMGWVKRGALKSTRGGYFGQNDLLEFGDAGTGTQIEAWSSASGQLITDAPYPFADDQWGFITYVADGTKVELYINGVLTKSSGPSVVTDYGSSAFNFNIGGGGVFNATGDFFQGEIDEVAIFDRAVTPGRVRQLYDAALGNVPTDFVSATPTVSTGGDVTEGQPFTLSIDPTGSPPFTYEWFLNGMPIPNSNTRVLTVDAAAPAASVFDPLSYTVKVTNGVDSKTSDAALVFVNPVLRWTGIDPTTPGTWAITGNTLNWATYTTAVATAFDEDYAVRFDDSSDVTNVVLAEDVSPLAIVFANDTKDYVITGAETLYTATGGSFLKTGAAKVTLNIDDFFVDKLEVREGTLRLGTTMATGIYNQTPVTIPGGTLEVALPTGTPYENNTALSNGGTLRIDGTGDFTLNSGANGISGTGNVVFDRDGVTRVTMRNTVAGTVSIDSGTVVFDGSQDANRLAPNSLINVEPGAQMEIHGVNALPTGTSSVSVTLDQSTLKVVTGGSGSTGATGTSHGHVKSLTLSSANVVFSYSGEGGVYNGESVQLNGDIIVTGSGASTIAGDATANAGNSGLAISNVAHTFQVADTAVGADLVISAEVENSDATGTASVVKTGPGTLQLMGAHSYSGTFQVDEGTLMADGSIAGPLVISAGAALAPGPSTTTFTAGSTTLGGIFRCELDGDVCDRLAVNGDLTFSAGATIDISVLAGGATAPFYQIITSTGIQSGPLPTLTGNVPAGYTLEVLSGGLVLVQEGADGSPTLGAVAPSGSEDFETSGGGFIVSAPISPEADWNYIGGSWFNRGADAGTGSPTNTSYLTSPSYTVTQAGPIVLTFSHKYDFEVDYDAGAVEVSINGGGFTRVLRTAFTQNEYNGTLALGTNSALAGQEGFINTSTGYPAFITSVLTVTPNAAAGDTIQVRFMSATDDAFAAGGWEIDSFSITNALPKLLKLEWPVGIMQYSDNLQPPWTDLGPDSPLLIDTTANPRRFFRLKP